MKKLYITPETLFVKSELAPLLGMSTGTDDNTGNKNPGGGGPGTGGDNEDVGAKHHSFSAWEDEL